MVSRPPQRAKKSARLGRSFQLLGKLCTCVWNCIQAEVRRLLGRDDMVPGMVGAIQRGTRSRVAANCCTGIRTSTGWSGHPVLRVGGAFTPDGEFLELPELDLERLQTACVFALYLAEEKIEPEVGWLSEPTAFALYSAEDKIEPEVVENTRTWPHSGFSVDQSVFLPAGDRAGIERLVGYMNRCPFNLSLRLVLEQGPRNAMQGRGSRSHRGGTGGRVVERRRRTGFGPQSVEPDLGHAHQAAVRDRPAGLS